MLTSTVNYYWTDARQHGIYLFYTIKKHTTSAFLFQNLSQLLKSRPLTTLAITKKPFDVICCLNKMKQSHWLLCVTRNCDWSRKITPLSNLTQMFSWGMKTYSESRKELRNLQILKKVLENQLRFCHLHQNSYVSRKAWMLPWILQEYARKTCVCGQHWRPFDSC